MIRPTIRGCTVLLVLAGLAVCQQFPRRRFPGGRGGGAMDPAQGREMLDRALDNLMGEMQPRAGHRMVFSGNLLFAHGSMISHFPVPVLTAYADALKSAGAGRIDINPTLGAWLGKDQAVIAKYDALVRHIRAAGLQLAINPAAFAPGEQRFGSFGEWQRAAEQVYTELARRYTPDILVVAHEPTTTNRTMGLQGSPREWAEFASVLARAVKQASPRTRCAAGGLPTEVAYFREFASVPELDALTLDVYVYRGLKTNEQMIETARRAGKPVYIEETWRPTTHQQGLGARGASPEANAGASIGDPDFEQLDGKWLTAIAAWASAMQMQAFTPFWTTTFFAYGDPGNSGLSPEFNSRVAQAIRNGERTPTFEVYRKLAAQYGAGGAPVRVSRRPRGR